MPQTLGRPAPKLGDHTLSWGEAATRFTLGDPAALPWAIRIRPSPGTGAQTALRTAPVLTYSTESDAHADLVIPAARTPRLLRVLESRPITAITLALLLRTTEHRSIADALVAESLAYSTLQAGPEYGAWLKSRSAPTPIAHAHRPVQVSETQTGIRITLDRRDAANAIDVLTRAELYAAFRAVAASSQPVDWVGMGPHFSAGGDLAEFGTVSSPAAGHTLRLQQNLPLAVAEVRDRLTARVHGACIGAGMELSSFAHRVIARSDTRWRLPEVAMGLIPGCGGTVSIPRRIGRQRALLLMLMGDVLTPTTALGWGLVDEVTEKW